MREGAHLRRMSLTHLRFPIVPPRASGNATAPIGARFLAVTPTEASATPSTTICCPRPTHPTLLLQILAAPLPSATPLAHLTTYSSILRPTLPTMCVISAGTLTLCKTARQLPDSGAQHFAELLQLRHYPSCSIRLHNNSNSLLSA